MTKQLIVQTRALLNPGQSLENEFTKSQFVHVEAIDIHDEYFCKHGELDPHNHTFEKDGKDARIRKVTNEKRKPTYTVETHKGIKKTLLNKFQHDIYMLTTHADQITPAEAKKIVMELGFPQKLAEISKKRDVYKKEDTYIHVDTPKSGIKVIEVSNEIENETEYEKTKKKQGEVFEKLGIEQRQIISDGYTYRKITQVIKNNPKIKKNALEKDLKETIKQLRAKEMLSGEAFRDAGDGWHENPTYETIYHDMLSLNQRIIDIKKDLLSLK